MVGTHLDNHLNVHVLFTRCLPKHSYSFRILRIFVYTPLPLHLNTSSSPTINSIHTTVTIRFITLFMPRTTFDRAPKNEFELSRGYYSVKNMQATRKNVPTVFYVLPSRPYMPMRCSWYWWLSPADSNCTGMDEISCGEILYVRFFGVLSCRCLLCVVTLQTAKVLPVNSRK